MLIRVINVPVSAPSRRSAASSLHEQTINLAQAVSIFKMEGDDAAYATDAQVNGFHDPAERRSPHGAMRGAASRFLANQADPANPRTGRKKA